MLSNLSGLLSKEDPQRAVQYAVEALANQTEALENDRNNAKLATKVVVTLNTLGSAQSQNSQNDAAINTFCRAIEISDQLLDRWPQQPTYQRDLVISLNHLGLALSRSGDLQEAGKAFERALQNQRQLVNQYGSDAETHSMLGGVLNNIGFLHKQLGDGNAAAVAYDEAVQQQSIAAEIAPEVDRYRDYLRKHEYNLAELEESS